jgi:hypothetical protein
MGAMVARWGDSPGEVVGHRLSHRPPDVPRHTHVRRRVFEDLPPGSRGESVSLRPRDPRGLRCRLARHQPSPSVQPVTRLDCLSWDCPKIAPPSSCQHRSPLPERPSRAAPSGRSCHGPSAFRPRGFPPPRRLAPPIPRACLATRSRPWGSSRFRAVRPDRVASTGTSCALPRDAALPFEAFPPSAATRPPTADHRNVRQRATGRAVVTGVSPRRSPPTLPPRPLPLRSGTPRPQLPADAGSSSGR